VKIQTRLTGFFIIVLATLSYILVWLSTHTYRQELNRLNAEVCNQQLEHLTSIAKDQDSLFFEKVYSSQAEAQQKAIELIKSSQSKKVAGEESYPFVITAESKIIVRPKQYKDALFPWNRFATDEMFQKGHGELRFDSGSGERIIVYQAFKPWRWLICYSYPADSDFYQSAYDAYFRQVLVVLCSMVASVGILLWLIQRALSPLDSLVESATNMASGIFPARRKKYSSDEIGLLARAFDDMSAKMQESMQTLYLKVKERREKEKEIRELIENSPLAIAIIRPDKTFFLNEMFTVLFGYAEKDMEYFEQWFEFGHPDDISAAEAVAAWEELFSENHAGSKNFKVKCKNGRILDIEARQRKIGRQNLLIFNDLTEIKDAERRLRETRNYLNQLFNSVRIILVAINEKGIVTQWNQAMETHTGIKSPDALGGKLWLVAPFLKGYRNDIEQTIVSEKTKELYREIIIFKDKRYYFNVSINPLVNSENKGAVIILEDVTELVRQSEQLIQAQKMETVGTLTGGLAHDFNNALGGIKGSLSMIKYYLHNSPEEINEIGEFAEIAEKSVLRASNMVEQLLTLSRKSQLSFKPVNLDNALKNVLDICRSTFDKSILIKVSRPAGKAMIKADQTQIEQVLLNLLINAEHSMTLMRPPTESRGGLIEILIARVKLDKNLFPNEPVAGFYWKLSVKDAGVGINTENLPKIFDPFFTTKSRGKGTGLGLSMVYNIIDLHHGFVDVKSEPGNGSVFSIFLPEFKPENETGAVTETDPSEIIHGEGTILIVDDEDAIRTTAGKMLKSLGYRVLTAENGEEGCELFKQKHKEICAVLLDIAMPKMSGDEAYDTMKKIDPQLKVLLSSGFINDDRVRKTLENGADGFIKKPYSITKLSRKIHEILRR